MTLLLEGLINPVRCPVLSHAELDLLVRTARSARLLGVLSTRIEGTVGLGALPSSVADHMRAAAAEAMYLRQMVLRQLGMLQQTLAPLATKVVALKGAAYILRGQPCAAGRLPRDIDILVARERLPEAERLLLSAGWTFSKTDQYDQRYYREWSHELPPMRASAMPLELDLHHGILPPLGRLRPETSALLARAVPAAEGWWTLCTADQVLHAAAHLFQDPECAGRVRDVVDIDSLVREGLAADARFAVALAERAIALGLEKPLWYALRLANEWLSTPLYASDVVVHRPGWSRRAIIGALAARSLAVTHPDEEPSLAVRGARSLMALRAHWIGMPPRLLAFHATNKLLRSLRPQSASA